MVVYQKTSGFICRVRVSFPVSTLCRRPYSPMVKKYEEDGFELRHLPLYSGMQRGALLENQDGIVFQDVLTASGRPMLRRLSDAEALL
jgi:hypothetical protein